MTQQSPAAYIEWSCVVDRQNLCIGSGRLTMGRRRRLLGPRSDWRKKLPYLVKRQRRMEHKEGSFAVKLGKISKRTTEKDLWSRLGGTQSISGSVQGRDPVISSIHLKNCPDSPYNYAYVNCYCRSEADSIVKRVDKKMLLDSNLLTAKLKSPHSTCEGNSGGVQMPMLDTLCTEFPLPESSGFSEQPWTPQSPCTLAASSPHYTSCGPSQTPPNSSRMKHPRKPESPVHSENSWAPNSPSCPGMAAYWPQSPGSFPTSPTHVPSSPGYAPSCVPFSPSHMVGDAPYSPGTPSGVVKIALDSELKMLENPCVDPGYVPSSPDFAPRYTRGSALPGSPGYVPSCAPLDPPHMMGDGLYSPGTPRKGIPEDSEGSEQLKRPESPGFDPGYLPSSPSFASHRPPHTREDAWYSPGSPRTPESFASGMILETPLCEIPTPWMPGDSKYPEGRGWEASWGDPGRGREVPGDPGQGLMTPWTPGNPGQGLVTPWTPGDPGMQNYRGQPVFSEGRYRPGRLEAAIPESRTSLPEIMPVSKRNSGIGRCDDVATVKVLIHNGNALTEKHVDLHFSSFGKLTSACKIRSGNPDYVYVNFEDPCSAQEARRGSPYCILGATLTALPSKAISCRKPGENSEVVRFVKEVHSCDPLAVKYVIEDSNQRLKEILCSMIKLNPEKGAISVCAEASLAGNINTFVHRRITFHEAKISRVEEVMECCYLPVLADPVILEQFAKSEVPFEVKILRERQYIPLEELAQALAERDVEDVRKLYVQSVKGESTENRWYWKDGSSFEPYDASVNQVLEQAFVSKVPVVEVPIGSCIYKIDIQSMTQTNTRTKNVRKVERRPETQGISVEIRAHSDHLLEVQREVLERMQQSVKSVTVPLGRDVSSIDHLLQIACTGFVSAKKTDNGDILLRGSQGVVTDMELQLTRKILQMKPRQLSNLEAMKKPDSWEPQEDMCELKLVAQGTTEWTGIEDRMKKAQFHVEIVRIERIQNQWLWDMYSQSHKRMSNKNSGEVNERELFHGTRNVPPVKIYNSEQGFDNRLSSRGMWGEGAYFAVRAAYSDRYAYTTPEGHKQMFLAKVITGITYKCSPDNSLKAPPKKSDHPSTLLSSGSMFEDERYDSVSGNTGGSKIFVIYEHGRVYPAYLITYKTGSY